MADCLECLQDLPSGDGHHEVLDRVAALSNASPGVLGDDTVAYDRFGPTVQNYTAMAELPLLAQMLLVQDVARRWDGLAAGQGVGDVPADPVQSHDVDLLGWLERLQDFPETFAAHGRPDGMLS